MINELIELHHEAVKSLAAEKKRYLFEQVQWQSQAICILGSRGVGKSTLICQAMQEQYQGVHEALYLSADNFMVTSFGLFNIAKEFFKFGGEALFIDEVHKYPNWTQEIKNIIDTYKGKHIVFTASSVMDLRHSKFDLSRRVVYYELRGLSFREYLDLSDVCTIEPTTLNGVVSNHMQLAEQFGNFTILKHFREYLAKGYYPFFLEGKDVYFEKLFNVVEKIIYEDISANHHIRNTTIAALKKLLWLIASSTTFTLNIDKVSKNLRISREMVYNCLNYLERSNLINNIYPDARGMKLVRKPEKIVLENTNLSKVINGELKIESRVGNEREIFFVNQLTAKHRVNSHEKADFLVDGDIAFEIGGSAKTTRQLQGVENSFLVVDDIEVGFGNRIPLYLFGMLY